MTLLFALALLATPLPMTPPETVTAPEVLAMMARIPAVENEASPAYARVGHWERLGVAGELAVAIATVAPSRETAALMALYAAFEGGNQACAVGDGGKSLGPFQLQRASTLTACSALPAARAWLKLADWSWKTCAGNPPDERLALLASGSCQRGRQQVRKRAELARRILTELPEE
jgi:hypothetical protein